MSGGFGKCCFLAGMQPIWAAQGVTPAAMAGNPGDTSQIGSVFFQDTSHGVRHRFLGPYLGVFLSDC